MLETSDISTTLRMISEEHLDVRTVTLGVNLNGCANPDARAMAAAVHDRICRAAEKLVATANAVGARYGVEIVNKRLAISPASVLLEGHTVDDAVALAKALDRAAAEVGVNLLGGFTALVPKGLTQGERTLIESLPRALAGASRVGASVKIGAARAGIAAAAVFAVAEPVGAIAAATEAQKGFGA